jgi:hypothetical protein
MSSHTHLATIARTNPASTWVRPLHIGMAQWINSRRRKRGERVLGSVYGDRFTDIVFEPRFTSILLAYIHNNPCRASIVTSPEISNWTSHRAYRGLEPAPSWLNIEMGLEWSGFDFTDLGRRQFHEFVGARRSDPKNPSFSGRDSIAVRTNIREYTDSPLKPATAIISGSHIEYPSVVSPDTPHRSAWHGSTEQVAMVVAQHTAYAAYVADQVRRKGD